MRARTKPREDRGFDEESLAKHSLYLWAWHSLISIRWGLPQGFVSFLSLHFQPTFHWVLEEKEKDRSQKTTVTHGTLVLFSPTFTEHLLNARHSYMHALGVQGEASCLYCLRVGFWFFLLPISRTNCPVDIQPGELASLSTGHIPPFPPSAHAFLKVPLPLVSPSFPQGLYLQPSHFLSSLSKVLSSSESFFSYVQGLSLFSIQIIFFKKENSFI